MTPAIITPSNHEDQVYRLIDQTDLASGTKRHYRQAIAGYLAAGHHLGDAGALAHYAATLPHSGRVNLKAAVSLWAERTINQLKGNVTPNELPSAQAAIMRLESIQEAIKVKAPAGVKAHLWLSQRQVIQLLDAPANNLAGQRDRLVLALLVGAGLRREEATALTLADLKLQPVRGKFRTVLQVHGKGAKNRVVPISDELAGLLDQWTAVCKSGHVLRSFNRRGDLGESLSAVSLFKIVRRHGAMIGKPELAPHDLRRTYAQLGYEKGVPITQISKLLGHANVATTQRYLNLELNLESTVSDHIWLGVTRRR